jgi:hypothetical protein
MFFSLRTSIFLSHPLFRTWFITYLAIGMDLCFCDVHLLECLLQARKSALRPKDDHSIPIIQNNPHNISSYQCRNMYKSVSI